MSIVILLSFFLTYFANFVYLSLKFIYLFQIFTSETAELNRCRGILRVTRFEPKGEFRSQENI